MTNPLSSAWQLWVKAWRKVYRPMGFKEGYNFPLFILTVGGLMGFTLARFQMFDINHLLPLAVPWQAPLYATSKKVPILLHIIPVLLSAFFVCFQFVPAIRHKFRMFHRINGYFVIITLIVSEVGAFMSLPTSGGAHPATRNALGVLAFVTTITIILAYVNIKRLRIDLHREFMIRTWVYAGTIITARVINFIMFSVMANFPTEGPWYTVQTCRMIWAQYAIVGIPDSENPTPQLYPGCTPDSDEAHSVIASMTMGPENASSQINICLTVSQWLAMALHAILLEVYFRLTIAESHRLREVSRERRIARGWESKLESGERTTDNGEKVVAASDGGSNDSVKSSSSARH